MKDIVIDGRKFQYEICTDEYCFTTTKFYDDTIERIKKQFLLFGKLVTSVKSNFVFEVLGNIENSNLGKKDVKNLILKSLIRYDRQIEIDKGEII